MNRHVSNLPSKASVETHLIVPFFSLSEIGLLTTQFCGSLYNANATYSSEVSVAVASATALAIAATQGKDPTDLASFPECAVSFSFRCPLIDT